MKADGIQSVLRAMDGDGDLPDSMVSLVEILSREAVVLVEGKARNSQQEVINKTTDFHEIEIDILKLYLDPRSGCTFVRRRECHERRQTTSRIIGYDTPRPSIGLQSARTARAQRGSTPGTRFGDTKALALQ